jgi:hypothetical protein
MRRTLFFASILSALSASAVCAADPVTFQSLLAEMVDRDHLARLPVHSFRCLQASSYDRAQTDPNNPATWFANHDYEQFIRTETNEGRKEWVIMEHEGPGAIVRFWTPLHGPKNKQIIRFYFDGAKSPGITANLNDLMRGRLFVKPPFAFVASDEKAVEGVAGDLYLPIPFAKGCKITLDSLPFYYNINYRAYEKGTEVKTFAMNEYEAAGDSLKKTADVLKTIRYVATEPVRYRKIEKPWIDTGDVGTIGTIQPRGELVINLPPGRNAIHRLVVNIDLKQASKAFCSTVLTANFDGEATIWCPVGEFFGCGDRLGGVQDWYRFAGQDAKLTALWVMPYGKSAHVALKNCGTIPVDASIVASVQPCHWDDRSMHFHATWRHQYPIETKKAAGTMDWNYLEATGQGVYVGDTLTVFSPSPAWYGEGDERVYVDGEKFPSHLGTGTEDYYGYAWGMAREFSSPFLSMPRRDQTSREDWRGYTTTSRVRLLDEIPFQRSLKFDMEIWDWAATKLDYSAAAFWYARPGATCNRKPMPEEAAKPIMEIGKP